MKKFLKSLVPPIILEIIRKKPKPNYGFFGNYKNWRDAVRNLNGGGYENPDILSRVKKSLLKVKNGEAVHERDSVIFDKKEYSWPILAGLLWIASKNGGSLDVLDFGGSLGSSYFQNREFLQHLKDFKWNIVEQKKFVECGIQHFEDNRLRFFPSIEECLQKTSPNVFLASGVIQYIEKPYELLEHILGFNFTYIIFDRTMFLKDIDADRITVQKVPPEIYNASYPAWFLNEKKFLALFAQKYILVGDFISLGGEITLDDNVKAIEKGFIFRINEHA